MLPDHFSIVMALCALLAAGSAGLLLWLGGTNAGPRWAEIGLGVGFLAGFIAFAAGLPLIDDVSNPILGETALAIIAIAAVLAFLRIPGAIICWIAAAIGIAAGVWVYAAPEFAILQNTDILNLAILGLVGLMLPFRLHTIADKGGLPIFLLICIGAGMGLIAVIDHATILSGMAFAYVAALAGISIWMWPLHRRSFAASGLAQGAAISLSIAAALTRNSATPPWGLLPLIGCLFPDLILERLSRGKRTRRRAKQPRPIGMFIIALIFVAIGLGVALWSAKIAA